MRAFVLTTAILLGFTSAAMAQTMPGEALLFLDKDGDGQVTEAEFTEQMKTLFDPMDTDKDGQLESDETQDYIDPEIFILADADGNGSLSASEYDAQMKSDFATADVNGDGVLN